MRSYSCYNFIFWIILCLCVVGCTSIDTEKLDKAAEVIDKVVDKIEEDKAEKEANSVDNKDSTMFSELNFCWGGFKGSNAAWDKNVEIANLNVGRGMSYSWVKGGCETLGATERTDASKTLACLFCKIDDKWVGGKFDWISTSRVTRDFHNIETGYNGWDKDAISKATAYRFVIVSSDGRHRTNVIEVSK